MLLQKFNSLRISIAVALILSVFRFVGCLPMTILDSRAVDYRALYRGPLQPKSPVVVVAIDETSIETQGRWPWPRSLQARLLRKICAAGPLVVGMDVFVAEPTHVVDVDAFGGAPSGIDERAWKEFLETLAKLPSDDALLASAIEDCNRVVLGYFFDYVRTVPQPVTRVSEYNIINGDLGGGGEREIRTMTMAVGNLPQLTAVARETGYLNTPPDLLDGHLRRLWLVLRYNGHYTLPLALAMLRVAYPDKQLAIQFRDFGVESVRLGDKVIPVDEAGRMTLNPRGPGRTFEYISAAAVLSDQVPADKLAGKLVVLGLTATALVDVRPMAFDGLFPGAEVHATAIDNILTGDVLYQPRWVVLLEITVFLFFAMLLGKILEHVPGLVGGLVALACLLGYFALSQWMFEAGRIPLGFAYPTAAIVLTYTTVNLFHFLTERRAKLVSQNAFGLYLTPELARILVEDPEQLKLGGAKRTMTVLFSDIRSFTTISEQLSAEGLVEMLNAYLTVMTRVVSRHSGMVDKYVGDALVAIWGAPVPTEDHAKRACDAAMEMLEELEKFSTLSRERGWPVFDIGIGVHTGEMIVGNMGSSEHLSYTVIGDNVNLGSRLEGLTKHYGVRVLASEATVVAARLPGRTRELDLVTVKGRVTPVRIFELLPASWGNGTPGEALAHFDIARTAYTERNWAVALAHLDVVLEHQRDDGPSLLLADRCRRFSDTPPPPDWRGVTVMDSK